MTGAIFLDFRKAFDLVDHEIIISKLRYYLNNDATVLFLRSFLLDRTQTVLINGNFSKPGNLKVGVVPFRPSAILSVYQLFAPAY
jgi:hypothetical protein